MEWDVSQSIEHLLMVQWIVGSIPLSGHIKLFIIAAKWSNKGNGCGMYYLVHRSIPLSGPIKLLFVSVVLMCLS